MKPTMYVITKPREEGECKWCIQAALELSASGYRTITAPLPLIARQAYYKSSGTKTIPQIYTVDEDGFSEHIGGYEETLVWIEERKK